jgi:hypothetical protein
MDSQDLREPARPSRRSKPSSPKQNADVVKDYLSVSVTSKAFNIYVVKKGTSDVASFALTNTGASSTGGVVLVFPSGFTGNITVTWVLGTGIASLSSEVVTFSSVSSNTQTLTLSAPATTSSDGSGFPFTVNFTSGGSHDPQIIVTPIGAGPGKNQLPKPVKGKAKKAGKPAPKAKPVAAKAKAKAPAKRGVPARKNKR